MNAINTCIKTGCFPQSSLPLGEIRETKQAVKILFQQPASENGELTPVAPLGSTLPSPSLRTTYP